MCWTGLGGGFENSAELHVMNYKTAMNTGDKEKCYLSVEEEDDRMNECLGSGEKNQVADEAKVISSTWAMKKKVNGTF